VRWLLAELPSEPAFARSLKAHPLDPQALAAGRGVDDDAGGEHQPAWDLFELAVVRELLREDAASVGGEWAGWLRTNLDAGSTQLLSSLLQPGSRPDLLPVVARRWEVAVAAPMRLRWGRGGGATPDEPDEPDRAGAAEDVLGPPWVEPNRHCTLMFYLNDPPAGGAETTFPEAATHVVALPGGNLSAGVVVEHAGMPECSKGVRVRPFKGGGALFYHKRGDGTNDPLSLHGGCPPLAMPGGEDSEAWKINGFMWNVDNVQGPSYFGE
jgi:hypothetical protein